MLSTVAKCTVLIVGHLRCVKAMSIFIVVLLLLNTRSMGGSSQSYSLHEDLVKSFYYQQRPYIVKVSPDLKGVAVAFKKDGKQFVWSELYGKSKSYENVHRIQFSHDSKRMAFMAEKRRHFYVVVDGTEYGPFNTLITDSVIFSPNGERFAFVAGYKSTPASEQFFAIVDGVKQKDFDELVYVEPTFSPDNEHLIYFAANKKGHYAVIDGISGQIFPITGVGPFYSKAHSAFAFMGARNDTAFLVLNDSLAQAFYVLIEIATSASTSGFAYTAMVKESSNQTVILNDRPMTQYHASKNPRFSPDGQRFAFWASDGENQFAVVDSIQGQSFSAISDIRFSPGSKHYYYMVFNQMSPRRWSFVVDSKILPEMSGTVKRPSIFFSPDESRYAIAYDADSSDERAIIDGIEYSGYTMVGRISFDSNAKHVAFIAERSPDRGNLVFVDGEEIEYSDIVGPNVSFSSDGEDILYWVNSTDSRRLFVNHEEVAIFENSFPTELKSNDEGDFIFYAVKRGSLYRITVSKDN